jgi:hypothetical protein
VLQSPELSGVPSGPRLNKQKFNKYDSINHGGMSVKFFQWLIVFQKSLYRRRDAGVLNKIFIGHKINNNILTKSYNLFFTKHRKLIVKE